MIDFVHEPETERLASSPIRRIESKEESMREKSSNYLMQTSMGVLGLLFISAMIVLCCLYIRRSKEDESELDSKSMSRGHSVIESSLEQVTRGAPIAK